MFAVFANRPIKQLKKSVICKMLHKSSHNALILEDILPDSLRTEYRFYNNFFVVPCTRGCNSVSVTE